MDIVQELIDIHEGLQRLTAQTIKIVEIVKNLQDRITALERRR